MKKEELVKRYVEAIGCFLNWWDLDSEKMEESVSIMSGDDILKVTGDIIGEQKSPLADAFMQIARDLCEVVK